MPVNDVAATLAAVLCAWGLMVPCSAMAVPSPEEIIATAHKLETVALDANQSFAATGQVLERPGMVATFSDGSFRPIARADGRLMGLLFEGTGSVQARIPQGVETLAWQSQSKFAALDQPFTAAWLRFSDFTGADLQGDAEWQPDSDPDGSAFRIHANRTELLDDPQWTRRAPNLLVDRLLDLYGGSSAGGHVLAEFRTVGEGSPGWLSYYHNPRGALMEGETTSWYQVRKLGGAPPLVTVLASFGEHPASEPTYDIAFIDLDMTFPTATKAGRNLVDAEVVADIGLVSLNQYGLETVVLELESQRNLCTGQSERPVIRVSRVVDGAGNALAAIHRGNRLVIPLAKPVPRGEQLNLSITYAGAMTQGIPIGPPDTSFSEIGPWAFYPRAPRIDRHASKVSLHLPRFLSGVAPGDLIEERKEKDGYHFTYEEPGGVRTLMVVVGDLVRSKSSDEGSNPRIITWVPRHVQETLKDVASSSRGMVDAMTGIWGAYPYSTLSVVPTTGHPFQNWTISNDGQGGQWSCLPPGPQHPWEAFAEGPSAMLVGAVISPPAFDIIESRYMDQYATQGVAVGALLQFQQLARQWWGHMVPPRTYRDLWITESIVGWTGLRYALAALGKPGLKDKTRLLHDLAAEGQVAGMPLALGARLDRQFLFDGFGRGPLLINALIDELGGGPFGRTMNALVNRASGPGVSYELFRETLETIGTKRTVELVEKATHGAVLPRMEYAVELDADAGVVRLMVTQIDDPLPITLPVELVFSPKKTLSRTVQLAGPVTTVEWEMPEMPKRVVVDPLGMGLLASLKKGKAPDAAPTTPEEEAP